MLILVCIWIFPFRGAFWMMDTIGSDMRIYTIGYSAFDMNGFIRALKDYSANCLIDVRSVPSSRGASFHPRTVQF